MIFMMTGDTIGRIRDIAPDRGTMTGFIIEDNRTIDDPRRITIMIAKKGTAVV